MASPASDKNDGSGSESSGGIKAMLPLILNIVLMPVMAFLMTQFVLVPALNKAGATGKQPVEAAGDHPTDHGGDAVHPAESSGGANNDNPGSGSHGGGAPMTVMLKSVTVNVAGTMGGRLMMATVGLRGSRPKFDEFVKDREEDLRDATSTLLQTKTLMDLEKQGSRNIIKSELKAAFLKLLGPGTFTDVVLPELAIQ
ncbi:MAG: flagellar basal body-associated protein FliL [Verrucomicrobiota bacterium]|jgi:flagellar basal body-associated protein FliL